MSISKEEIQKNLETTILMQGNKVQEYSFFNNVIKVDLDKKLLQINDQKNLQLVPVLSDRILNAFHDGLVYLDCSSESLESCYNKPLYYSSRNIISRKINNLDLYMDFLIYSSDEILPNGTVNRSLGHCNDVNEYEVHQVIAGTVLSLFRLPNGARYYGIFKPGDYFEIPAGAFHCSYILDGPAIVSNFYCNAYWGDNIDSKPYFELRNDYTVEKHRGCYLLKSNEKSTVQEFTLDTKPSLTINGFEPYHELFNNGTLHQDYKKITSSIFDLFYSV